MPNKKNNAASFHVNEAATSANDKGVFHFSFPHSKEPTAIFHPSAAFLSVKEKKRFAYDWLNECVLPAYVRPGQTFLQTEFEKKYYEIVEKYIRCLEDKDILFKKLKMWLLSERLN